MWSLCLPTVVLLHLAGIFGSIRLDFVAIPEAYKYNDTLALRYLWLLICMLARKYFDFSWRILLKFAIAVAIVARPKFVLVVSLRAFSWVLKLSIFLYFYFSLSLNFLLYGLTVVRVEDSMRPGANSGHPTTSRPPNRHARFAQFGLVYRVDICANLCKKCNLPHKKYIYKVYVDINERKLSDFCN